MRTSTTTTKRAIKKTSSSKAAAAVVVVANPVKATAATVETKGQSKLTVENVIAIRKLKVKHPEMSAEKIKTVLGLDISGIMVGRAIRGISHSHIDMCGLEIRPFNTK